MSHTTKTLILSALCLSLVLTAGCDNKSNANKKNANADKPGIADLMNPNHARSSAQQDLDEAASSIADSLGSLDGSMSHPVQDEPKKAPPPPAPAAPPLAHADKATPQDQYKPLESGNQLMFSYYALGNMPVNYTTVMPTYSRDYRRESDQFKKNDILEALKPKVDAEIERAKTDRYFTFEIDAYLEKYDFETKAFPMPSHITSPSMRHSFTDNDDYTLGFSNGGQFKFLKPASEDSARKIEAMRSKGTGMHFLVYLFAQGIDPSTKAVEAEIVKIVLTDKKGVQLAVQE